MRGALLDRADARPQATRSACTAYSSANMASCRWCVLRWNRRASRRAALRHSSKGLRFGWEGGGMAVCSVCSPLGSGLGERCSGRARGTYGRAEALSSVLDAVCQGRGRGRWRGHWRGRGRCRWRWWWFSRQCLSVRLEPPSRRAPAACLRPAAAAQGQTDGWAPRLAVHD